MSKASSTTLTIGTKQFVVHEAFETTRCVAGSNSSSLTPITNVASASPDGPEMMTRFTEPPRCPAASARVVKRPVDSITTSAPSLSQGSCSGSRSAQHPDVLVAHQQVAALDVDRHGQASLRRVVAKEMGQGLGGREVVHPDHLDVGAGVEDRPQEVAADATEAIDTDPHRHLVPSSRVPGDLCQQT